MKTFGADDRTTKRTVEFSMVALILSLTVLSSFWYVGSKAIFIAYGVATALLIDSLFHRSQSIFRLALFTFLTLGCWAKLVLHLLLGTTLIEPVGRFDGSPASWDLALQVLLTAFVSLVICAWILPCGRRSEGFGTTAPSHAAVPHLRLLLVLSAVWTLGLLLFNYHFAILKIGTEPTLRLHSYLYVFIAFMVAWGNVILLAAILFWMIVQGQAKPAALFYLFGATGALTTFSMGSRAQMVLYVLVPLAVHATQAHRLAWRISRSDWLRIIVVLSVLFVLSILAVSADRLASFAQARPVATVAQEPAATAVVAQLPPPDDELSRPSLPAADPGQAAKMAAPSQDMPSAATAGGQSANARTPQELPPPAAASPAQSAVISAYQWQGMLRQLGKLVVDRWIGLEGVLAVTSHTALGMPLLQDAIREDPSKGVQAIYQRMSGSQYAAYENFTFMTIPGPIALLYYSASLPIVALGMAVLFLAGWAVETATNRVLRNAAVGGAVGVALAYLLVQTNFPKALGFFALEMVLFLAGLAVLRRLVLRASRPSTASLRT